MKRQRILKTLVLLAGMAVIPGSLLAQDAQMAVSGIVKGAFKEEANQAMDFGEMDGLTGAATDRDIDLLTLGLDPINGNAGYIDFKLNKSGTTFTLAPPPVLSNAGGDPLGVDNWECGLMVGTTPNTVTDPADQTGLDQYSGDCTAPLLADLTGHNGARRVRIYVGGRILASVFENAIADTYTGTVNIFIAGI